MEPTARQQMQIVVEETRENGYAAKACVLPGSVEDVRAFEGVPPFRSRSDTPLSDCLRWIEENQHEFLHVRYL